MAAIESSFDMIAVIVAAVSRMPNQDNR